MTEKYIQVLTKIKSVVAWHGVGVEFEIDREICVSKLWHGIEI